MQSLHYLNPCPAVTNSKAVVGRTSRTSCHITRQLRTGRHQIENVLQANAVHVSSPKITMSRPLPTYQIAPLPPAGQQLIKQQQPGIGKRAKQIFTKEYQIRGSEVGPNQKASMVTVANLLQEHAGNHAVSMWGRPKRGFSIPGAPNIILVMTRLHIRMSSYPKWGDILNLETYHVMPPGRLTTRRDWVVEDGATGRQLGAASSTWVTLNMDTRRVAKLPDGVKELFLQTTVPPTRTSLPVDAINRKIPSLDEKLQTAGPTHRVHRWMIDMNGHTNNVIYLAWVLESIPDEVHDQYELYEVEVEFKSECKAGDVVHSAFQELRPEEGATPVEPSVPSGMRTFLHTLHRGSTGECSAEIVRARTAWRKIDHVSSFSCVCLA